MREFTEIEFLEVSLITTEPLNPMCKIKKEEE